MPLDSLISPAVSRRSFTTATTAALSAAMVHSSQAATEEPRELRLGIIGCGGRGTGAMNDSLTINSGVKLVAAAMPAPLPPLAPIPPPPLPPAGDPPGGAPPATVFLPLAPRCCRWPMWPHMDRPTHRYCEAPTAPGVSWLASYCASHQAMATRQRGEPEEQAA